MFSWGSKFLFSMGLISLLTAFAYGILSGDGIDNFVGVLSLGYKGGVGEHLGYTILISFAFVFFVLGIISFIANDGNLQDGEGNSLPPASLGAVSPSFWPPLLAFGLASLVAGIAFSKIFMIFGIVILVSVLVQWSLLAWSERVSSDEGVNQIVRNRVLAPFDVPMISLLIIAFVVIGVSRVLLAVPAVTSSVVAMVVASAVFLGAIFLAKVNSSAAVRTSLVAFGAVVILFSGVVAAALGERDFHHGADGVDIEHSDSDASSEHGAE